VQSAQDPSQNNVDNMNSVIGKSSTHFRNKKKAYLLTVRSRIAGTCIGASVPLRRVTSLELI